jgi:hypothetical protein
MIWKGAKMAGNNTDKRLMINTWTNANGADQNSKLGQTTIFDNSSGQVNYTMDSVSVTVSIMPTAISTMYYTCLFITDPGGSLPTGSDGVTVGAFASWLTQYRKQIWMTEGGIVKFNAGISEDEKLMRMEAGTKRVLKPGQKLILCVWTWNKSASADNKDITFDVNVFYHY